MQPIEFIPLDIECDDRVDTSWCRSVLLWSEETGRTDSKRAMRSILKSPRSETGVESEVTVVEVMVIDGNEENRISLRKKLDKDGLEVVDAPSGEVALTLFGMAPAQVIVLDVVSPGGEGFFTVSELRRVAPDVKILAVSRSGGVDEMKYEYVANSYGAHRTLIDPSDEEILEAIRELIPREDDTG